MLSTFPLPPSSNHVEDILLVVIGGGVAILPAPEVIDLWVHIAVGLATFVLISLKIYVAMTTRK